MGHTPVASVRLDSEDVYYWAIDGEWLLDGSGKKIRAQGDDGRMERMAKTTPSAR